MNKISLYILTYNSEQYLSKILDKLKNVVDEILIVDSGSSDATQQIVEDTQTPVLYLISLKTLNNKECLQKKIVNLT